MSAVGTLGKVIGAASVVGGVVGAAAVGSVTAQRRSVRKYRERVLDADHGYDGLPSDRTYSVMAPDGVRLHVEEVGPKDAPLTVVFSHGWMLRLGSWHYQRTALAGPGFGAGSGPEARLVFYDQRSHGTSERADSRTSSFDHLAADLEAVISTAAPTGPVVVIGHSMGGMALQTMAARNPAFVAERLAGFGMLSTSSTALAWPEMTGKMIRGGNPLLRTVFAWAGKYPGPIERARASSQETLWVLGRAIGFGSKDVSPAMVDYIMAMIAETPLDAALEFTPALLQHNTKEAIGALASLPGLVLCGEQDRMTPVSQSRMLAKVLPDAEFVLVPGGHAAMMESPEAVNPALRRLFHAALDHSARTPKVRTRTRRTAT